MRRLLLAMCALAAFSAAADDWLDDVNVFAAELPAKHINAFTKISRADFDAAVQELREDLPELEEHEVVARLLRIVTSIGDAHTTIYGDGFSRFPIALYWFSDGLVVTRASEQHRDLIGARLVAIDARPVAEVVAEVAKVIPHENDAWLRELAPDRLVTPEILHALRVIPTPASASFRFVQRDGTIVDRTLGRVPAGLIQWHTPPIALPLHLRDLQSNYWYDYAPATGTLYVQYNRCANDPKKPIADFGRQLGAFARANPVSRLVLDLRHNGGGDSSLLVPLLTDLYNSSPQLDDPNRFYVAIGPATFSSAMMNAAQIDEATRATLIGLPTGGKPNAFGNVSWFTLPHSRLTVQYSTRYFELVPGADPPSILPEVPVDLSSSEYFAGRDPVMERILGQTPRRRAVRP